MEDLANSSSNSRKAGLVSVRQQLQLLERVLGGSEQAQEVLERTPEVSERVILASEPAERFLSEKLQQALPRLAQAQPLLSAVDSALQRRRLEALEDSGRKR